ncbi:PP2C family protein-serine/threonine phosphatase [Streptomyces sp. NPDC014889]|uniref:PP2C family protein-serine/threonine phosphatase n=1 Tax=Streptomyces sp. NPDC014889 TaxID=3364928 RepID=UPI0036FAD684
MDARKQRVVGLRQPWQSSHLLLLIPVALIVIIAVSDIMTPADIVLGPLLVIAPALTAWFAGPRLTSAIGALTVLVQGFVGWRDGLLLSRNVLVEMVALAVLSTVVISFSVARDRHRRQLARVRTVAEAAQRVLLWPLPTRLGPLQLDCVYLAAEAEAETGGDLYAAARTDNAARVLIGDVRGKGLPALGEAALLLGAFREAVHQHASLPQLAAALERSIARYLTDFDQDDEAGERFVTALLLEIPDDEPVVRITSCGHPAPMLLSPDNGVTVPSLSPAPPLGVGLTDPDDRTLDVLPFGPGDTLLLYTDGVIEARNRHGAFYPFAERAAQWTDHNPEALLHRIQRDLFTFTGGGLGDDVALIAIRRTLIPRPGHDLGHAVHSRRSRRAMATLTGADRPGSPTGEDRRRSGRVFGSDQRG